MTEFCYCFFETPLGTCGIVWSEAGIAATQLPDGDRQALRGRLLSRAPKATSATPTGEAAEAIAAIRALFAGESRDVSALRLDMARLPDFPRRVYAHIRRIPPGRITTYGAVARALGEPGAARAVGQAMSANPFAPIVPCHRVLAAGGRLGGFSARGGAETKRRLLALEGVAIDGGQGRLDL